MFKSTYMPYLKVVAINAALTLLLGTFVAVGFLLLRPAQGRTPTPVAPDQGESMWRPDNQFGFRHNPAMPGSTRSHSANVTYTIDERGNRITPDPVLLRGSIVVLGCSWTFGDGVNDAETFPYLLGQEYWVDYKVVNKSCMAWGTTQAYLACIESLAEEPTPSLVLYGWIEHHRVRKYLGEEWLQMMAQSGRSTPWFEVVDEKPVFRGLADASIAVARSPELTQKEITLTKALVLEMKRQCDLREVPFFVVSLPNTGPAGEEVLTPLLTAGVQIVDLHGLCQREDFIHGDGHPAASAHRKMAEALAKDARISSSLARETVLPYPR